MHMTHKYVGAHSHTGCSLERQASLQGSFKCPRMKPSNLCTHWSKRRNLNYKSSGFKELVRLTGSCVWCLQKGTCLEQDGPRFIFVWVCVSANKPLLAFHQELIRSCQGVRGAPEEFGVGTDFTTKDHSCRGVLS